MEFEKRKAATLASLGSTETDKSPKGTLDAPIIPLLDVINSHPSYFTTSSCSGRISILSQPTPTTSKPKKKASGGSWLFITHDPADPDSVLSLLFPSESTQSHHPSRLVFRFEPLIVAIECKDLASAQSLVSIAIASGFRESGITSASKRVIIAIRCSIRLELPLGDTQKIMVSPEYVRYLVEVANEKMEANRKRAEGFLRALQSNGFVGSKVATASVDQNSVSSSLEDNNGSVYNGGVPCNDGHDGEAEMEGRVQNAHSGKLMNKYNDLQGIWYGIHANRSL